MTSNLLGEINNRITTARNESLSEAQYRSSYLSNRDAALSAYWSDSLKKGKKANNSSRFGARNGLGREKDEEAQDEMIPQASELEGPTEQQSRRK